MFIFSYNTKSAHQKSVFSFQFFFLHRKQFTFQIRLGLPLFTTTIITFSPLFKLETLNNFNLM